MPLNFPGAWRLKPPDDGRFVNSTVPNAAIEKCIDIIMKITTQGDRQKGLEHFKRYFAATAGIPYNRSSSESWALSDLWTVSQKAAENAPLFIQAIYDGVKNYVGDDPEDWEAYVELLNEFLEEHEIGYAIRPPNLELREEAAAVVPIAEAPPTLTEHAATILQESSNRSEELLAQRRGREAVQEILWLLETVTTAFRGIDTATGKVEGKYFNQIVRELREYSPGGTLNRVLEWVSALHGYLSSPTGGGIRHGLDLKEGVGISEAEARLFCNLIRSYLSFLLGEYRKLTDQQ
jgi:hypothetical protein